MKPRPARTDRAGWKRATPGSPDSRVSTQSKQELIRTYKSLLKEAVEARPSGIRLRIAAQIGKNKSFVSQITSPNYKTPLPEKYVDPILDAIHLTKRERERFLDMYQRAHPRSRAHPAHVAASETRTLRIKLPRLASERIERDVDRLITQLAHDLNELAHNR